MSSWKPEVIADSSGKWSTNALRFATEQEAYRYAKSLSERWTLVTAFRATKCDDPVNYYYNSQGHLRDVTQLPRPIPIKTND